MATRVLIVDPQPLFCESLAASLSASGIEVVGWTTDEREAWHATVADPPDIVLAECELAAGSGLNLSRKIHDHVRVVILTRRPEGQVLLDAVAAGAVGCISHDMAVAELQKLVRDPRHGRFLADPDRLLDALRMASGQRIDDPSARMLARLTPREREILRLLTQGLDDNAMAQQLYLSSRTVRTHVGNVLRKLGVHSRAEAARLALAVGGPEMRSGKQVVTIEGPRLTKR